MLDDELKNIIQEKGFKNFWEAYDYLMLSGYSELDGFGICLEIFEQSQIWENVAYVRTEIIKNNQTHKQVTIGVINKNTEHLRKLFSFYLDACANDIKVFNIVQEIKDFENLCDEKYTFKMPSILLEYLKHTSKLHYGFNVFNNINYDMLYSDPNQYTISFDERYQNTTSDNSNIRYSC